MSAYKTQQYISQAILFFACLFLCFAMSVGIVNAENIDVRLGQNKGYDRIVFEWDQTPQFQVSEDKAKGSLTLSFSKSAQIGGQDVQKSAFRYFTGLSLAPNSQGVLQAVLEGGQGTNFRTFSVGKKLIVDISGTVKADSEKELSVEKAVTPSAVKAPESKVAPKVAPQVAEKTSEIVYDATPQETTVLKEATKSIALDLPKDGQITLSSTKSFGAAVYVRNGYLWIVTNDPEMVIAPQVKGASAQWLGVGDRFSMEKGTVFRYPWPFTSDDQPFVKAEGGGLLWRLVITKDGKYPQRGVLRSFEGANKTEGFMIEMAEPVSAIVNFQDPVTGQDMYAATMAKASANAYLDHSFADFSISPAIVGAVIARRASQLTVTQDSEVPSKIVIASKQGNLNISERSFEAFSSVISEFLQEDDEADYGDSQKYYRLDSWAGGGIGELAKNRQILETRLASLEPESSLYIETALQLAKLHLGNFFPQESIGYFNLAEQALEGVAQTPEFLSLKAAANALSGQGVLAQREFANPALSDIEEIAYWQAYNEGRLENWDRAYELTPKKPVQIKGYPEAIRNEMALTIAEGALRAKDLKVAKAYLGIVQDNIDTLQNPYLSYYRYLQGEQQRQEGDIQGALEKWRQLLEEGDKLFRAKAGLSWVKLALLENAITPEKAIEILEQIRFTWRGDGLETQINHELGLDYIKNEEYKKALSLLRDTASNTKGENERQNIVQDMQSTFNSLFLGELSNEISAIQAVTIYEAFSELLPTGEKGDEIIEALVDRLIEVDLIKRAATLLEQLIDNRLTGLNVQKAYLKLARLHLINNDPQTALDTLARLDQDVIKSDPKLFKEKIIIEAKSLSELKKVYEALSVINRLGDSEEVDRMKADISWSNESWNDAANALVDLIGKKRLAGKDNLDNEEAKLVLNAAVAINLAGDLPRLQNYQRRFDESMQPTPYGRLFRIVTRPPGDAFLSSRETILKIVDEVDLFEGILDQF